MNKIFGFFIIASILIAALTGNINSIAIEVIISAREGVKQVFSLIGILTLWLGIAKIAEKSGLLEIFTKILYPIIKGLFPSIPKNHPAMGSILMNLSANLFGFGNAATPFGLKAMDELQKLNRSDQASEAMCTFLALNVSSITLIPNTIIAIRINAGSTNPMEIVGTALFASCITAASAICFDWIYRTHVHKRRWI